MCSLCGDMSHKPQLSRRVFLRTSALAALLPLGAGLAFADAPAAPNAILPADALQRLLDGNARYVANTLNDRDYSAGRAARVIAQYPIAAILSCADARVAPELAFDQGPGELFVARVAGNIVTPDLIASLEYAAYYLGVPLVMVLGHTGCGAVSAAIKVLETQNDLPGHIAELVRAIKPAVMAAKEASKEASADDLLNNACIENVRRQVAFLKTTQPILESSYAGKKIDIVGAMYDLPTGKISLV